MKPSHPHTSADSVRPGDAFGQSDFLWIHVTIISASHRGGVSICYSIVQASGRFIPLAWTFHKLLFGTIKIQLFRFHLLELSDFLIF